MILRPNEKTTTLPDFPRERADWFYLANIPGCLEKAKQKKCKIMSNMIKSNWSNLNLKHTLWKWWLTFSVTSSKCKNKSTWKPEVGLADIKIIAKNITLSPSCIVDQKTKIHWSISLQTFIWPFSTFYSWIFWTAIKI